jgi:hypothetical protein
MFNMVNRRSVLFALCLMLAAFSLAAHLIADAACLSQETTPAFRCDAAGQRASTAGEQLTINGLHTGVVSPTLLSLVTPVALYLALANLNLNRPPRFSSPPVQPPKASSIA